MGDSLDDLDVPHVAEWLLSGAVGRRRPKPRVKRGHDGGGNTRQQGKPASDGLAKGEVVHDRTTH